MFFCVTKGIVFIPWVGDAGEMHTLHYIAVDVVGIIEHIIANFLSKRVCAA